MMVLGDVCPSASLRVWRLLCYEVPREVGIMGSWRAQVVESSDADVLDPAQ